MKFWHFLLFIAVIGSSYFLYKHYVNDQLMQAVKSNDIELAKKALKWGADIDYYSWDMFNTLRGAIEYAHPKMVQFLLDHGASMKIQRGTRTALEYSQDILDGTIKVVAPKEAVERWKITVKKQKEIIPIIKQEIQKRMKE